jgi:predicted ATPase
MITSLQIKNFKGWKDTGALRLAPLTVFFGTNSSGKSSLGQFLMMLKQTANSPDRNRVLHPGDDKTPVDLGTFQDLLYKHNLAEELSFALEWRPATALEIKDVLAKESFAGDTVRFEGKIGFENPERAVRAVCRGFDYKFIGSKSDNFLAGMAPLGKPGKYKLITESFVPKRKEGRVWPLPHPTRFFGFPDELSLYYKNAESLNDLAFEMQTLLQGMAYLGPLREEPKRQYAWPGETPEDVGSRGERWVSAFLAAIDRKISMGYRKTGERFDKLIAKRLKDLGLIQSFSIAPIGTGLREYRVRVKVSETSSEVSIPDVGFGVSQVLPVIVQSFYASAHATVIIEQPELHLHPAVQSNLADLFIAAVKAREDGSDRSIQFVIESHSEHFLRRLQRRIAEEEITQQDVAIYFCDSGAEGSQIDPLQVDLYGNILNWPKNFFGDQMNDIAEMQRAGIRRRRKAQDAVPAGE